MRTISWNCQGLGPTLTEKALINLKAKVDPSIIFIMETKNKEGKVERVRKSLAFNNERRVEPDGKSGGLVLWWDDRVEISFLFVGKNLIDAQSFLQKHSKNMPNFLCLWSPW